MRLLSFERNGRTGYGALVEGGVVDLGAGLGGRHADLAELLAADALAEAADVLTARRPDHSFEELRLLPVIPHPGKIWCCGLNYAEHVRETRQEIGQHPSFFLRTADSQLGHMEAILRPRESVQLDFEGEIAVVIGRPGRRISEHDAWSHIAGYACYNDATVRDWQRHGTQWAPGKNFWRTGAFGPWLVTADEIAPWTTLRLATRLNGTVVQQADTTLMIHGIARQIAYLSTIAPLAAGDVIVTGTPGGVGARREPPLWMKPGDVVEVEIDRVGVLRNPIADET